MSWRRATSILWLPICVAIGLAIVFQIGLHDLARHRLRTGVVANASQAISTVPGGPVLLAYAFVVTQLVSAQNLAVGADQSG